MEVEKNDNKYIKFKTYDKSGFRIQAKNMFLTYPKCSAGKSCLQDFLLNKLELDYCMVVQETHEDGSPHLHALISAKRKFETRNPKCFDFMCFHGNYQAARNTDHIREYLLKSDKEPLEYGIYQSNCQSDVQKRIIKNKLLLDLPLHELVDTGQIALQQYKIIADAKRLYTLDKLNISQDKFIERCCIWITGPPGSGKSFAARTNYGSSVYEKPQNKWWDAYSGEDVVVLDDLDKQGECLSHYIKIWADKYRFNAEIKGGTIKPTYKTFIITSNYYPEDIWGSTEFKDQETLCQAIRRRFTFYQMKSEYRMEVDDYVPTIERRSGKTSDKLKQQVKDFVRGVDFDKLPDYVPYEDDDIPEYNSYMPPC